MDPAHKQLLRRNRTYILENLDNLEFVFDGLVERNLYHPEDYEDFKVQGGGRRGTVRLFLNSIECRGPNAFHLFIQSLRDHKQGFIANLLYPVSAAQYPAQPVPRPGRTSHNPVNYTGPAGDSMQQEEVYQMKSKPRGLAVIINNKHFDTMAERKGTDVDGKELRRVFKGLGFVVSLKNDKTKEEMKDFIFDVSTRNHQSFDCFILAILSHGEEGVIYGTDEQILEIETIVEYFEGGRCPSLAGKPKLFIFQACRGVKVDRGFEGNNGSREVQQSAMTDDERTMQILEQELQDETDTSNAYRAKLPSRSDMLIAYSTVPGFVSWRDYERGSWFIQALCKVLSVNAHKEDLLSMLTMVNNKVAQDFESSTGRNKQMPAPVSTLRKKVFFNSRPLRLHHF